MSVISALGRWWSQKDGEFKVILGYLICLKPAWTTWQDHVSKIKKNNKESEDGVHCRKLS
jgi:hypothetical protein